MMNKKTLNENSLKNITSSKRNSILKKNLSISFISKFFSVFLNYLLVPLTITYLNEEMYGIWITLLSILSWFGFCDIGLGNGLRNKLTECLSNGDIVNAKKYISTAYVAISIIVVILIIPLVVIVPLCNWNKILNTISISNFELIRLIYVIMIFFLVNFVLSIINQIYYAYQKARFVGFIQVISNFIVLIGIILLKGLSSKSIVYLALIYGGANLITNVLFSIIFFNNNREIMPSVREFHKSKVGDILTLGIRFFVIQLASIVIFTTDSMVITQVVGPKYVTGYNVAQKLFAILTTLHVIIVTPLWSAYTEAYVKKDYEWIRKIINKLNLLMVPIIIGIFIIYFSFDFIVKIWIKQPIEISKSLVLLIAIYTIISIWNNIYSYLLNGVGSLKISFWICILISLVNIPLSIYLSSYINMGINGIVISNILCLSIAVVIQPIQTYIILNNKLPNSVFYD